MCKKFLFSLLFLFCATLLFASITLIEEENGTITHITNEDLELSSMDIYIDAIEWTLKNSIRISNTARTITKKVAMVTTLPEYTEDILTVENLSNLEIKINGIETAYKKVITNDLIYYIFEATFKEGTTNIDLSCNVLAGFIPDPASTSFSYNLLTANNWKGRIGQISIKVALPHITLLEKYSSFFTILGDDHNLKNINSINTTMIHQGSLDFSAQNYAATEDLYLKINANAPYLHEQVILRSPQITLYDIIRNEMSLGNLTAMDKKLVTNAILAWHGYRFEDQELINFYSQFEWYNPHHSNTEILSE